MVGNGLFLPHFTAFAPHPGVTSQQQHKPLWPQSSSTATVPEPAFQKGNAFGFGLAHSGKCGHWLEPESASLCLALPSLKPVNCWTGFALKTSSWPKQHQLSPSAASSRQAPYPNPLELSHPLSESEVTRDRNHTFCWERRLHERRKRRLCPLYHGHGKYQAFGFKRKNIAN